MSLRTKAIYKLILTMLLVSLTIVLAKQALHNIPFFTFLWLQMATASIAMLVYTFIIKQEKLVIRLTKQEWLLIFAIALLNYTIVRTIFIYTLDILSVTTHAYIMNFTGLVTMLLSVILLKESPRIMQFIGALIAVAGLWLYFHKMPTSEEMEGIIWLSLAVFCLALTNILLRRIHSIGKTKLTHNRLVTFVITLGSIPLVIFGALTDQSIEQIELKDWLIILLNGLVAVAFVMVVFSQVMQHLKAYEASVIATTGVIFTALFALLILNDTLNLFEIAGIFIMLIGIFLVQYQKK